MRKGSDEARAMIDVLPPQEAGRAVLDERGAPFRGDTAERVRALERGSLVFHPGAIRGAVPTVRVPT